MKNIVFILTGDLAVIHWLIFPAVVFLFPQKVVFNYAFLQSYYNYFYRTLAAINSCSSTVHFSDVKVCNYPLLSTYFLLVCFRIPVTVKKTTYCSSYIFRAASFKLKWELPLEVATFTQNDFFQYASLSKTNIF